jgi:predicted Zn finger-like uncharacterized protein
MSIKTTCPECQTSFTLSDELEGKKIRCRKCQAVFGPVTRGLRDPAAGSAVAPRPASGAGPASSSAARKVADPAAGKPSGPVATERRSDPDKPPAEVDSKSSASTIGAENAAVPRPQHSPNEISDFARIFMPRYQLRSVLGAGGMGAVYRAVDTVLGREVALKVIHPDKLSPLLRKRFEAEARAVAHLDHPHIVRLFDVGQHLPADSGPQTHYLALEFVEGGSLSTHLRKKPMSPVEAARLVRLLARAMQHAHERGIAHRDLKPDNILMAAPMSEPALNCSLGCPKITDFGLAREVEAERRLTQTGAVMGTPEYMSPEQAEGSPDTGQPADVWALGVILYRLLAGKLPFDSPTMVDLLFRVCKEAPESLRSICPDVPKKLERICLQCLEKKPAKRPTMKDLAGLLEEFLAQPTGPSESATIRKEPGSNRSGQVRSEPAEHGASSARSAVRKKDDDKLARRLRKRTGGMPWGWLVCAALGLILFVGAVVGGLWYITQKVDDTGAPPLPTTKQPGPQVPTLEGKDGEPHEVPKDKFPPAGFPPPFSAPSEDRTVAVVNPILRDASKIEKDPKPPADGTLTAEAKVAGKSGTVFIKVARNDGGGGSGSGFFASTDAPNIVITNAHVVGMLEADSDQPTSIDVHVHSGQRDEKTYKGRVVGVDRDNDLAVIDIGVKTGLPSPLKVKPADSLSELDKVFVFGFPLGEELGKEITVRDTTVSSFRKRNGVLDRIQIKGGMDPGNSGGPVLDSSGHVIGVSVAGYVGREICFAIPGSRVQSLLHGQVRRIGIGQPIQKGLNITAPARIEVLDPLRRIKEIAVEVWTGKAPPAKTPSRPASTAAPAPQPGDSPRQRFVLHLQDDVARGEVELPALSAGEVYWVQPMWVRKTGETLWGSASVFKATEPVVPKKVELIARSLALESETRRRVLLSVINRVYDDDREMEGVSNTITTRFSERVMSASPAEVMLSVFYEGVARSRRWYQKVQPDTSLETLRSNLNIMKAKVQLDAKGNQTKSQFVAARTVAGESDMHPFHESVKSAMDLAYLPLPNKSVTSSDSWKTTRTVTLGEGSSTMGRRGTLELTCTCLGTRSKAGREEAVVGLTGRIGNAGTPGKAYGQMIVDVETGTIRSVELFVHMSFTSFVVDTEPRKAKYVGSLTIRLQRDL